MSNIEKSWFKYSMPEYVNSLRKGNGDSSEYGSIKNPPWHKQTVDKEELMFEPFQGSLKNNHS